MNPFRHLSADVLGHLASLLLPFATATSADAPAPLARIAFGSCNRQTLEQPLWETILSWQPQLWIWLGDNIYGDSGDPSVLAEKWTQQKRQPGYARFRAEVPVIGIWDDHDYGVNNGGADFPIKAEAQKLLLDFLDVPADSARRKQEGVYTSAVYGPPGQEVCVVLLDVRYFRDAPQTGGDLLGEAQWQWLESTLTASSARIHLIASGTQIIPTEHNYEKWADYPAARERLIKILATRRVPGVVLLSGDRHFAEISRLEDPSLLAPIHEVTASGLTHVWKDFPGEPNQFRVGTPYAGLHFGAITIDWAASSLILQIRGQSGDITREVSQSFPAERITR